VHSGWENTLKISLRILLSALIAMAISNAAFAEIETGDLDAMEQRLLAFKTVSPVNSITQMTTPDNKAATSFTIGGDYLTLGRIANVPASGITVYSDSYEAYALIGMMGLEISAATLKYDLEINNAAGRINRTHPSEIIKVKWAPDSRLMHLPYKTSLYFGTMVYTGKEIDKGIDFTQPYVALSHDDGILQLNAGYSRTRGDLDVEDGVFASARVSVNPATVFYVDYNEADYHKLIINHIILPYAGVDCSGCKNDSVSAGLAFKCGDYGYLNIGAYDIADIRSPMGSVSFRMKK